MLIKCPECELQISDKAISCPHCGYVLSANAYKQVRTRTTRRRRLPNGFGQISKITNKNLQKPYRAMVTIGKNDNGKPVCKLLKPVSYFETYNEAYEALMNNAKNPYTVEKDLTVQEVYDRWMERYSKQVSEGRLVTIKAAWKYAAHLRNVRFADIRIRHIVDIIENGKIETDNGTRPIPESVKIIVLTIFRGMYDYAIEYEIVSHNYASEIKPAKRINRKVQKEHRAFTKNELSTLWDNVTNEFVRLILIQCYSGWRPSELLNIKLDDVDLEKGYITGGMKTDNGKNRIVPICPKIKELVASQYNYAMEYNSEHLFFRVKFATQTAVQYSYTYYANEFNDVLKSLELNTEHTPHDCRKTFVTIAKENELDEYAIKYIVGHAINDLTERVYTDRTIEWLIKEINKIV